MNLMADECVDRQIVDRLREEGHEVLYVAEMDPSIPDDTILVAKCPFYGSLSRDGSHSQKDLKLLHITIHCTRPPDNGVKLVLTIWQQSLFFFHSPSQSGGW